MIEASRFVEEACGRGFGLWAGVPCQYLSALIDCVSGHPELRYVSSANEGDAVAAAAGAALAGRAGAALMQNSGLGNAVNPLASLTWVFRIPVLLVISLRGDPEFGDEPQHELMGTITGRILSDLRIPWEQLGADEPVQVDAALGRAAEFMKAEERPYALVVRAGALVPGAPTGRRVERVSRPQGSYALWSPTRADAGRPSRTDALRRIIDATPREGSVLIASTGYTGRELYALEDRPNQLYMVGSMGCASSLALGVALVRPRLRVVVVEGDGSALMRMGNLATLGAYGCENLYHVVLDNESHESTGGQATVSNGVSFAKVASACGYALTLEGSELSVLDELFGAAGVSGPRFAHLKIRRGTPENLPRPRPTPDRIRARFVGHIQRIDGELAPVGSA